MGAVHILLVEDTLTQALMMQHLLESEEFKVSVVKDGHKALQFLSSQRPDLILSDVSMPEIDGYQLCQQLKADPSTRDIPFVLLSSFRDALDIVKIVNSQADSFLLKRFDKNYIVAALQDILAGTNSKLSRELSAQGDPVKLASMLTAAFRTTVYLLPMVTQD